VWWALLLLAALVAVDAGYAQAAGSGNPINDRLLSLSPAERATTLAQNVGQGCVGTAAFPMGVVSTDKWKSLAYWSVRCKDGRSFAIQIAPDAHTSVIDCKTLQANGKECFASIATSPAPDRPKSPEAATPPAVLSGSGFFIASNYDLVTNVHVVESCRQISAYTALRQSCSAKIIADDRANDLALLRCDIPHPIVPRLRMFPRLGEDIVVYGFPLSGTLASTGNVTAGNITALAGIRDDSSRMQVSAPVQPGNSGGPVLDRNGNVVGVVVSKLDALKLAASLKDIPQNVNFAIKSSVLAGFLSGNGVASSDAGEVRHPLSTAEIADRARAFTVRVECFQ
jgi:serine protease Do